MICTIFVSWMEKIRSLACGRRAKPRRTRVGFRSPYDSYSRPRPDGHLRFPFPRQISQALPENGGAFLCQKKGLAMAAGVCFCLRIGGNSPSLTQTKKQMIAYKIFRNASGERTIRFADGGRVPADIAKLCAGKDRWISQIKAKCRDCGELFPFRDLNGGGQWCEPCQFADIDAQD